MRELRFTEDHEWVRIDDDGLAVVGITDYAQEQLGEIVFIELPEVGDELERGRHRIGQGRERAVRAGLGGGCEGQ